MKTFSYSARDSSGRSVEGTFSAELSEEVDKYFRENNLIPIQCHEVRVAASARDSFSLFERRIPDVELIAFTRQFAAAYEAGVAVPSILDLLSKQTSSTLLRVALSSITQSIQSGRGLTDAFSEQGKIFDREFLAILKVGETTGGLGDVLNYAATLMETKVSHKESIRSALLYPKLVISMIALTIVVVVTFVVPQFSQMYEKFGAELPLPTRILISLSALFKDYWWLPSGLVGGFFFARRRITWNPLWLKYLHEKQIRMPILGSLFLKIDITHFCTTWALLLRAGVRITDATKIAVDCLENRYLRSQLGGIVETIERGGTLRDSLSKISILPPMMVSMIAMGEESGRLEEMLDRVAKLYGNETEILLKKLPTLLEPVLLAILFGIVLFLALAVYLPMWKMASAAKAQMK